MFNFLNKHVKHHPIHYCLQCILIIIFMLFVLFPLGSVEDNVFTAIGASTLASSILTMFAIPNAPMAAIHRVIGGYVIGILIGLLFHLILITLEKHLITHHIITMDICGALAVGITMLIMAILNLIHPPPAGFSLAIVIGPWNRWTICVVIIAVPILCLVKYILRNWFIKLI